MATKGENGGRYGNVACYMLHATCHVAVCFRRCSPSPSLHLCFPPLFSVYFLLSFPVFISGAILRSRIPRHTSCVLHLISCRSHEPMLRLSSLRFSFLVSRFFFPYSVSCARTSLWGVHTNLCFAFRLRFSFQFCISYLTSGCLHDAFRFCFSLSGFAPRTPHPVPRTPYPVPRTS